jgi:hypothetical protein
MKIISLTTVLIILALLIGIWYYKLQKPIQERFDNEDSTDVVTPSSKPRKDAVPDVSFPFKNIRDDKNNKLNIIAISAPFRESEHELLYESYKSSGMGLLGLSSYLNFPNKIENPYEDRFHEDRKHDYIGMVSAWVYCFRDPGQKLQYSGLPLLQLTEADLKVPEHYKPDSTIAKEYDFIYICLDDNDKCDPGWNWYNRNFDLAKKCFVVMCGTYNLKGVIVGRTNCELPPECEGKITTKPFLQFHEFQKEMQKARFLFVPNIYDASPRVITEAMLLNLPVLVNKNILGGWHNVIPGTTGEFFSTEYDIGIALDRITNPETQYQPRKWYVDNRGIYNSGVQLADFLKKHYPDLNHPEMKYASI